MSAARPRPRATPGRRPRRRAARSSSGPASSARSRSSAAASAGGCSRVARPRSPRPRSPRSRGRSIPSPRPAPDASFAIDGLTPLDRPQRRLLPDRHRADHPGRRASTAGRCGSSAWSTREVTLTFDELVELPLIERYVTIACVSNEVGGDLVGNAKWTGVRLSDVLDMAGVQPGATQIVPRSVDGWTAGFPTAWVTDPAHPRDAMIAVKMNDEPLPRRARLPRPARSSPGLYGYVSATKWLTEIELTTLEAFDAYWVPRGWAKEAPILTQSRIDVPRSERDGEGAASCRSPGVAWAPDRGISKVEVSVDGGDWQAATLATPIGPQTWVQWKLRVAGDAGRARDRGPRDRRHRRGADGPGHAAGPRRRPRPPPDRGPGRLSARPSHRRASGTLDRLDDTTPLPLRHARPLRRRHRRRARQPHLLPPGPRRLADRLGRPREGPGRRADPAPGRAARRARAARHRGRRHARGRSTRTRRPLDEPINEAFRVGHAVARLGHRRTTSCCSRRASRPGTTRTRTTTRTSTTTDEDGPDLLRVRITALAARAFVGRALRRARRRPAAVPAVRPAARPAGPPLPAPQRPPAELGGLTPAVDDPDDLEALARAWSGWPPTTRPRSPRTRSTTTERRRTTTGADRAVDDARPADAGPARGRRARAARPRASCRSSGRLWASTQQRAAVPRDAALPGPGARPRRGVHLQAGDGRAAARRLPGRDARAARGRGVRGVARPSGWGIVPPTVLRDGPFGEGMVQLWIRTDAAVDPVALVDRRGRAPAVGSPSSTPRSTTPTARPGHLLPVPGGHVYGVDHGVTFSPVPKLRTVLWALARRAVPRRRSSRCCARLRAVPRRRPRGRGCVGLLAPIEVAATARRIDRLVETGRVPAARPAAAGAPLAAGLTIRVGLPRHCRHRPHGCARCGAGTAGATRRTTRSSAAPRRPFLEEHVGDRPPPGRRPRSRTSSGAVARVAPRRA